MPDNLILELPSLEATQRLATALGHSMRVPLTVAFEGDLGAGKTQFIRFLAASLGVPNEEVTSPTYVLLQRYQGQMVIYHFDFYRLESESQVWDLGIDELFEQPVAILIEWADKFPQCLPEDFLRISMRQLSDGQRMAEVSANGAVSGEVLSALEAQLRQA
ncbi:MAG: tRNA (adenosine(37)-N6)-threonylcarbamoyltransferase complex ATPase subunit type 1 TsaE [bacterium]|nr:tRNA (adenosine(37)-N6)-threonylcarbamoyltransferase complex ATPase subunit type 1 TsaE [bacterium]